LDGPGGFTSAESDDVKADGCKSYGGGGWKIKRGGQSGTVVIQREAVRAWREQGDRDRERERGEGGGGEGTDERKRDAREDTHVHTYERKGSKRAERAYAGDR